MLKNNSNKIEHRTLCLTLTNLFFNHEECKVATFADVT